MDVIELISFLGVAILLTLTPGPDILFVLAQSISQNKKAGIITALGLCTGLILHITAATIGLSAMVYQSAIAFSIVKYAGAAYLLYLAWQAFKEKGSNVSIDEQHTQHYLNLYKKGIFMNILNPKVSLFFLALLPQFINQTTVSVPVQMLVLGVLFLVQAFIIFTIVSVFSDRVKHLLAGSSFISSRMNVIKGFIFCLIGIQIAFGQK